MLFTLHASVALYSVLINTIFSFVNPIFFVFHATQRFYSTSYSIKTYVSPFPSFFLSISIFLVFQSSLYSTFSEFKHLFSFFIPFQQLTSAFILFFSIFTAYSIASFRAISVNFLCAPLYFYISLCFPDLSFIFRLDIIFIVAIIFLHEYFSATSISA